MIWWILHNIIYIVFLPKKKKVLSESKYDGKKPDKSKMQDILYDNKPGFFKKDMPQKSFYFFLNTEMAVIDFKRLRD